MRAKFLLIPTISVLGLSMMFLSSQVQADDVYVDLSVLDSLGNNNSPVINSGPLFPVVRQSEVKVLKSTIKPVHQAPAQKATPKKSAPAKVTIPPKADVKVEVKRPQAEKRQSVAKIVKEPAKPVVPAEIKDSPFGMAPVEVPKEQTIPAPVAPIEVKTEPLPDVNQPPVIMEPINGSTPLPTADDSVEAPKSDAPESMFNPTIVEEKPVLQAEQVVISKPEAPLSLDTKPESPVSLDTKPEAIVPTSNEIVFDADSYELDDSDKTQLENLLSSFEDPHVNKIAIYAFNVDDGKDVFRKKRLSLNRTIEVRSYLLTKGYKNFSIKVVNLTESNGKENKVMVEELK